MSTETKPKSSSPWPGIGNKRVAALAAIAAALDSIPDEDDQAAVIEAVIKLYDLAVVGNGS